MGGKESNVNVVMLRSSRGECARDHDMEGDDIHEGSLSPHISERITQTNAFQSKSKMRQMCYE